MCLRFVGIFGWQSFSNLQVFETAAYSHTTYTTMHCAMAYGAVRNPLPLAVGFYSFYRSLHYTPLSDIDFESLLFSTISNQSAWNFASRRGLFIFLIARKLFEINRRKVRYPKLVYTVYTIVHYGVSKIPWPISRL